MGIKIIIKRGNNRQRTECLYQGRAVIRLLGGLKVELFMRGSSDCSP